MLSRLVSRVVSVVMLPVREACALCVCERLHFMSSLLQVAGQSVTASWLAVVQYGDRVAAAPGSGSG